MLNLKVEDFVQQDTDKQVKDTEFPSITICTEGINMDAVLEAVTEDFNNWVQSKKNIDPMSIDYTVAMRKEDVKVFLYENYGINSETNIDMGDIVLAYSSPEPDRLIFYSWFLSTIS